MIWYYCIVLARACLWVSVDTCPPTVSRLDFRRPFTLHPPNQHRQYKSQQPFWQGGRPTNRRWSASQHVLDAPVILLGTLRDMFSDISNHTECLDTKTPRPTQRVVLLQYYFLLICWYRLRSCVKYSCPLFAFVLVIRRIQYTVIFGPQRIFLPESSEEIVPLPGLQNVVLILLITAFSAVLSIAWERFCVKGSHHAHVANPVVFFRCSRRVFFRCSIPEKSNGGETL